MPSTANGGDAAQVEVDRGAENCDKLKLAVAPGSGAGCDGAHIDEPLVKLKLKLLDDDMLVVVRGQVAHVESCHSATCDRAQVEVRAADTKSRPTAARNHLSAGSNAKARRDDRAFSARIAGRVDVNMRWREEEAEEIASQVEVERGQ